MATESQREPQPRERLQHCLRSCRAASEQICGRLHAEDTCIQTMPDVSPPKWHLAHTSWFFETFVLSRYLPAYRCFHPAFDHLFNSYYVTHGEPYPRPRRGLLSRPTLDEVLRYRAHVDTALDELLAGAPEEDFEAIRRLLILGINHEQQHQELLYTDIKHIFSCNPMQPAYLPAVIHSVEHATADVAALSYSQHGAGIAAAGYEGEGFAFDNEGPRHRVLLQDHAIADRLVTNAEYLQFMRDGGYHRPELWMSEGWASVRQQQWSAPLYWQHDGEWMAFGLHGLQAIEPQAPVCHVSFYEADAYARWAGARLPTEFEWEHAADREPVAGNLRESGKLQPAPLHGSKQFFGDVWEWTASPYTAYPGYRPAAGSIGEYNGKFMSNQVVLRGGSCVTPADHIRPTYRNFFYPADRWQFSGIRLAKDA